jgi:hypothetical protein
MIPRPVRAIHASDVRLTSFANGCASGMPRPGPEPRHPLTWLDSVYAVVRHLAASRHVTFRVFDIS